MDTRFDSLILAMFEKWGGKEKFAKFSPVDQEAFLRMLALERGLRADTFTIIARARQLLQEN